MANSPVSTFDSPARIVGPGSLDVYPSTLRALKTLEHGSARDIKKMSERLFQAAVMYWAKTRGWYAYHNPDSRRSEAGFLDLWLARFSDMRIMYRELKAENGKLSLPQKRMINFLALKGEDVAVWRPRDWKRIKGELK